MDSSVVPGQQIFSHDEIAELLCCLSDPPRFASHSLLQHEWLDGYLLEPSFAQLMDRQDAVELVMQESLGQLAPQVDVPEPGAIPDSMDPIWSQRKWQSYLLLRYLYFEPLPPHEFLPGQQRPGTLMRLMEFPARHNFYALKTHSIERLRHQLDVSIGRDRHRQQMIDHQVRARVGGLSDPVLKTLLNLATTFHRAFSIKMFKRFLKVLHVEFCLEQVACLCRQRCMIRLPQAGLFLVPEAIRVYGQGKLDTDLRRRAHYVLATLYTGDSQLPDRIRHYQRAARYDQACDLTESNWGILSSRCTFRELEALLAGFPSDETSVELWMRVLLMQGSHLIRFGMLEEARERFSRYLHGAIDRGPRLLATIFLAHICSSLDTHSARRYFLSGARMLAHHPEYEQFYYSSKGRFHLSIGEYSQAERDLLRAESAIEHPRLSFRSVMLFALTDLYLANGNYEEVLSRCRQLLDHCHREQDDHLRALAASTLGKVYLKMKRYPIAMRWFSKSVKFHRHRNNNSEISKIMRYQAIIYSLTNNPVAAMESYAEALRHAGQTPGISRDLVLTHMELAELLVESKQWQQARHHWFKAYGAARQLNLESCYFDALTQLQRMIPDLDLPGNHPDQTPLPDLPVVKRAMQLAGSGQPVTSRTLAEATGTCRTTAYGILDRLVKAGIMYRHGKGRATRYTPVAGVTSTATPVQHSQNHMHPHFETILQSTRKLGYTDTCNVMTLLNVSRATAKRRLSQLVQQEELKVTGSGRSTRYIIVYPQNIT